VIEKANEEKSGGEPQGKDVPKRKSESRQTGIAKPIR